jgi:hypothetical protein
MSKKTKVSVRSGDQGMDRQQAENAAKDLFVRMLPSITGAINADATKRSCPRTDLSASILVANGEVQVKIVPKEEQLKALEKGMPSEVKLFQEASKQGAVAVYMVAGLRPFVIPLPETTFEDLGRMMS